MNWSTLPKVELHLHLDCSLSYDVVSKIDPSISADDYRRDFIAPAKCKDINDYLTRAPAGFGLMQTKEALRLVVLDLFDQLERDHMLYAEIRFAPLLHTREGLSPYEVVSIVEAATADAVRSTGIEARLILCALRYLTGAQSLETVRLIEEFAGTLVAGFDIAGEAPGEVIKPHAPAFRYAHERGIPITAHAGENRGVANVWDTVRGFAPARIGHGVSSIEDPTLLDHLRNHGIHLEACPTSNVQTDCYPTYADHPIDQLFREGVSIGVNTDDRTISNITLTEEYEKVHHTFGWGPEEFLACNRNALRAAFIPDELRNGLLERLEEAYRAP